MDYKWEQVRLVGVGVGVEAEVLGKMTLSGSIGQGNVET